MARARFVSIKYRGKEVHNPIGRVGLLLLSPIIFIGVITIAVVATGVGLIIAGIEQVVFCGSCLNN